MVKQKKSDTVFAAQIRAGRQLASKTQRQLADAAQVSLSTIEAIEGNRSKPIPATRAAIVRVFGDWGVRLKDNGEVGALIDRARLEAPEES